MPTSTVSLALIGCGQIGRLHAERIRADGRGRIVAVTDPHRESAERLRRELAPEAAVFESLSDLLDHAAIDAAVVCSPTSLHFEQASMLLERGVPTLCEKPLADTRERIVALIERARLGPLLSLAYQRRYWSTFRTLRREVQSGRWGRVRSVTTHSSERWQQTIAGTWRDDPAFNPGGFIGDAGSHKIDMVFFVTGLVPAEVFAHSDQRGSRVPVVTTVSGRLTNGVSLSMNFVGDAQHWREDFCVHCEQADLSIHDGRLWIARDNRVEPLTDLEPESNPNTAFLDCLLDGSANQAPPECALAVWDFTQAVLTSARTREIVVV
ncbi:MAG: Gfo/Idh/MocA family oxidoreductase [Planctomycetales bacterium]|nr:Gfo/Idh/MocA family oxidoreductase [Planctomycetales bacterium]